MEIDFVIGSLKYRINSDGSSVTVIGCDEKYTGILIIALGVQYEGKVYTVTTIGEGAFGNCSGLALVLIPNSVTKIGNKAFAECTGLTTISVPDSVTEIGALAFIGCRSLKAIYVSDGNTRYDTRDDCNAIIETESNTLIVGCKSTVIPNSVTMIGDFAFNGCSDLTSVVIPDSVTKIGGWAFASCRDLASVVIPDSVTWIGPCAFSGTPWEKRMRQIAKK